MLPHAVDEHARGERILGRGYPLRQGVAPSAREKLPVPVGFDDRRIGVAGDRAREPGLYDVAGLLIVAAFEHAGGSDVRTRGRARNLRDADHVWLPPVEPPLVNVELGGEFAMPRLLVRSEDRLARVL